MLREARYFARMAGGFREFARTPPEPDPRALIERQLANRETRFLDRTRRVIFATPGNPYHTLFQWAGCEYADLERMVRADGLDAALESLRRAGVWLGHDEFKGKKPIERGGQSLQAAPADFVNPFVRGGLENTSSGSRSAGTVTSYSTEYSLYGEAQEAVTLGLFLTPASAIVALLPILPSALWLHRLLVCRRYGTPVERWFTSAAAVRDAGFYALATRALLLEARLLGCPLPTPARLPQNDFSPVAEWIARRRSQGAPVHELARRLQRVDCRINAFCRLVTG